MKKSTILGYYQEENTDLQPNNGTKFPEAKDEFMKKKRVIYLYAPIVAASVLILLSLVASVMWLYFKDAKHNPEGSNPTLTAENQNGASILRTKVSTTGKAVGTPLDESEMIIYKKCKNANEMYGFDQFFIDYCNDICIQDLGIVSPRVVGSCTLGTVLSSVNSRPVDWERSNNVCDWSTISCDADSNIVKLEIDFRDTPTAKILPLGNLKKLKTLSISGGAKDVPQNISLASVLESTLLNSLELKNLNWNIDLEIDLSHSAVDTLIIENIFGWNGNLPEKLKSLPLKKISLTSVVFRKPLPVWLTPDTWKGTIGNFTVSNSCAPTLINEKIQDDQLKVNISNNSICNQ